MGSLFRVKNKYLFTANPVNCFTYCNLISLSVIRALQSSEPFGVAHEMIGDQNAIGENGLAQIVGHRPEARAIRAAIAIQVIEITKFVAAREPVRDKDRRARVVKEVGKILQRLHRRERRKTRSRLIRIVDIRQAIHRPRIKAIPVDEISGNQQIKVQAPKKTL